MDDNSIIEVLEGLKVKSAEWDKAETNYSVDFFEKDVEAIDAAINAIRHSMKKEPPIINKEYRCECPSCGHDFGSEEVIRDLHSWHMNFCKYCGKALDWSEVRG